MDAFAIHEGAAAAYRLIDATNEYIAATSPWALAKDPSQAAAAVAGAVRLGGSHPPVGRPAVADHAGFEPEKSCDASARAAETLNFDRDGHWRAEGER